MSEIRNLGRDYLLRNLENYNEFRCYSKYPFSLALMTLQAVCVVLCDNLDLANLLQEKDTAKKLMSFPFFTDNQTATYQECFKELRNASSHMMENYIPKNSETGKFAKVWYSNDTQRATCLSGTARCQDIHKEGKTKTTCFITCPYEWEHCRKEIKSVDLKKFLFVIYNLLTDKQPNSSRISKKRRRRAFTQFIKNS